MAELFHIHIIPGNGATKTAIEKKISLAVDWFRLSDNSYIVYTTSDAKKWNARLKSVVRPNGYCLITVLHPEDYSGWMPKSFWTWLREMKGKLGY
jgi:hypothetical protein